MKRNISIPIDEERLTTLRIYMEQKNVDLEEELSKAIDSLYLKYVPIAVRVFLLCVMKLCKRLRKRNQRNQQQKMRRYEYE